MSPFRDYATPIRRKKCDQDSMCTCTDEMADRCEQNGLAGIPWRKDPPRDWLAWIAGGGVLALALLLLWIGFH